MGPGYHIALNSLQSLTLPGGCEGSAMGLSNMNLWGFSLAEAKEIIAGQFSAPVFIKHEVQGRSNAASNCAWMLSAWGGGHGGHRLLYHFILGDWKATLWADWLKAWPLTDFPKCMATEQGRGRIKVKAPDRLNQLSGTGLWAEEWRPVMGLLPPAQGWYMRCHSTWAQMGGKDSTQLSLLALYKVFSILVQWETSLLRDIEAFLSYLRMWLPPPW